MSSIHDILVDVNNSMYELTRSMNHVKADKIGLDPRAGWVFVNEDCIIVEGGTRSIDYYGGFEYVDESSRTQLGDYVVFDCSDDRVQEAIDCFLENEEESTVEE